MEPAVSFSHVSKSFRRGERHDTLRDLFAWTFRSAVEGRRLRHDEFWALRDVSFEVFPGRALGIIGPNGAGKSTTLKLLTRILRPSSGACRVRGRVGALIEVASGFHPDLTGRENTFLQGAIMGMQRAEISSKLDAIIEFAGVREFIDTPVKRYSSGMNARLGFSIAAHLEPDVLIIDEVLGVGDMAFQQRCLERMQAFKASGVTIVFVSHNLQAVMALCDDALHLDKEVISIGPAPAVISSYVHYGGAQANSGGEDSPASIVSARLLGTDGADVLEAVPGAELRLRVEYEFNEPVSDITFGVLLHRSTDGLRVYDANFTLEDVGATAALGRVGVERGARIVVDYRLHANVTRGQYHFECHIMHNPTQRFLARLAPAVHLSIFELRTWAGIADLAVRPELRQAGG